MTVRLFVTGTDTDVGKSVVTALLARAARARGTVVACKPVASGVPDGTPGEDAERIAAGAGHAPMVFATWPLPVSPHRAALAAGRPPPDDLLARIRALQADVVLVEGVGGWKVPVSTDPPVWVEDLARATGPDVLVVAANRLGVLNHTLLTLDAVRRAGFRVRAVALNQAAPATDASSATNLEDLRALCGCPVVPVPHLAPGVAPEALGAALLRVILPETSP